MIACREIIVNKIMHVINCLYNFEILIETVFDMDFAIHPLDDDSPEIGSLNR